MAYILKNKNIEIQIDHPLENYCFSRFDWTGKISSVKYKDIQVAGVERPNGAEEHIHGKGFYNEFGIEEALGYQEAAKGAWFHKIGIGILKKDDEEYRYDKMYQIKPLEFIIETDSNHIQIACQGPLTNGFGYFLRKYISLLESGFVIRYFLQNTGSQVINTSEYNHNFIAINKDLVGQNYLLKFPFELHSELFKESIDPGGQVAIGRKEFRFNNPSEDPFFFSHINSGNEVPASWELEHLASGLTICESCDFLSQKVNLWGWKHVISPELFLKIQVLPGQSISWTRTYLFK